MVDPYSIANMVKYFQTTFQSPSRSSPRQWNLFICLIVEAVWWLFGWDSVNKTIPTAFVSWL